MTDLPRRLEDGTPTELGRPLALTEELTNEIVWWLRQGLTQEDTIRVTGVARSTYYSWLDRARELTARVHDPDDDFDDSNATIEELRLLDLLDGVTGARARSKGDALAALRSAMRSDWRAAAWFLERSFPDEYGRRDRLDVSSSDREVIRIVWPEEEAAAYDDEILDAELVEEDGEPVDDDESPESLPESDDSESDGGS